MPNIKLITVFSLLLLLSGCNINVENSGGGTVTSTDGNILCGDICTFYYTVDQVVVLQATPEAGFEFNGWGGVCAGVAECAVFIGGYTGSKNVTALFSEIGSVAYSVGGSVNDLQGSLVLSNNGLDPITVTDADPSFVFPVALMDGEAYEVEVVSNPVNQTCSVTNGGGTVFQDNVTSVVVECIPGPASGEQSTIAVSQDEVLIDGTGTTIITVQAIDAEGNGLTTGGDHVVLNQDGHAAIGNIVDNNDGTYVATINNAVAEMVTISGTINGEPIVDTAEVAFTLPPELFTTITTSVASVIADGTATSTITIQAVNEFGENETSGGSHITISVTGSASISIVMDNGDGTYTATITNTVAEVVTVTGTIDGEPIADTATVGFLPGAADGLQSTITVSANFLIADGVDTATVTVQARDAFGNNLTSGGDTVVVVGSGDAIVTFTTDNTNGTYTATITNTFAEAITISATISGAVITHTVDVTFFSGPASRNTIISIDNNTPTTDDIVNIMVQATDAQGNHLTASGGEVVLTTTGEAIISAVSNNFNGTYSATITNNVVETVTISALINGIHITSGNPTLEFSVGGVSAISTIAVSSAIVSTGDTVTITVQAKDAAGNDLTTGGATVSIATTGSAVIGPFSDIGDGTYTATLTNTVEEAVTISGTINATLITSGDPTVSFITGAEPGVVDPAQSTISPSNFAVLLGIPSNQAITVQAKDAFGINLTTGGSLVTLSISELDMLGLGATITPVADNGDGTYTATVSGFGIIGFIRIVGTIDGEPITGN
ncbi:MAG: hypothetical protein COA99_14125 [Moraxellaceae bacterium]|nr:MAG: hypothetical protein COA99_14125 [Moraxellaceae bacterium]